eukprot:scaffold104058_cov62-Phaeocystis_antarctica.AAC.4
MTPPTIRRPPTSSCDGSSALFMSAGWTDMVHRRDLRAMRHTEAALGKATLHAAAGHRCRRGGVRTAVNDAAASPNWSMSTSSASRLMMSGLPFTTINNCSELARE